MARTSYIALLLSATMVATGAAVAQQAGSDQDSTFGDAQQGQQQSAEQERMQDQQQPADRSSRQQRTAEYGAARSKADKDSRTHRASELIGLEVMSPADESIGDIHDLVLDVEQGEVRYAAISVGGMLGVGDKLIAVPWRSLKCDKDQEGNAQVVLEVSQEQIESAPGFNQENWPDFADQRWKQQNDQHYETTGTNRPGGTTDDRPTQGSRTNLPQ